MDNRKLIIAEKPSLGMNIIQAIGARDFKRCDGYFEGNEYIVTWAFGHLLGLIDIEAYAPGYVPDEKPAWTLDGLPFIPQTFQFALKKDPKTKRVDSGIKKQYQTIKDLALRADVSIIIHAGDADREGEVIIRNILSHFHNKKPTLRLWLPDQTEKTIQEGLKNLVPDVNYNRLYKEGLARTYVDWLYGVNLTRLATLKTGTLLRIGRVIVPIVQAIYERDMQIKNFVPEPYFIATSKEATNGVVITLTSKQRFKDVDAAKKLCEKYNQETAVVSDIVTKRKIISPGRLYSLSKLQGVLGKKYKMSLKKSLDIIQSLYLKGYVTYPRTNTEFLSTAEHSKINHLIQLFNAKGYHLTPKDSDKSIYDDSKIESHSALTPTYKFPDENCLSADELLVYETIKARFLAVFCAIPCEVDQTIMTIRLGDCEAFLLKGDIYRKKGWKEYENIETKDVQLPLLKKGNPIRIFFKPEEQETTPPKHYTLETLNNYLKNPFKTELQAQSEQEEPSLTQTVSDEDYQAIFKGVEIGTEATRTGIIENAIQSKYISLKNNTYYIEPGGIFLMTSLKALDIRMDKEKTATLGRTLKMVYNAEATVEDCIYIAEKELYDVFSRCRSLSVPKQDASSKIETIGNCPFCNASIEVRKKGYFCSNKDCHFALWQSMKYRNNNLKITKTKAKALIAGKTAHFKLKSKDNKEYEANLKITQNGKYTNLEFESFYNKKKK